MTPPGVSSEADDRMQASDATPLGMVTVLLFIAGGLCWMASVGLLSISALMAYPTVIWVGATLLALTMMYAISWTSNTASPRRWNEWGDDSFTSTYDSVTGLPTNRLFTSILNQSLSRGQNPERLVAILMIELDHFRLSTESDRQINCNLIYRVQAARVKSALRTTDTVARIGERTFVVLLDHVRAPDEVVTIARKMQTTISLPFSLEGHELFLTSRIGISLSAYDGVEGNALLEAAAKAVVTARAEGYAIYGLQGAVVTSYVDSASTIAA